MNTDRLVILAAGSSTRMVNTLEGVSTTRLTKCMLKTAPGSKPFLHHLLCNASDAGFREAVIVTAPEDRSIREYFGNEFHNMILSYVVQSVPSHRNKPLGTADALLQVLSAREDFIGKSFCICNSDNLYSEEVFSSLRSSLSSSAMPCYHRDGFAYPEDRTSRFAVVEMSEAGEVTGLREKPDAASLSSMDISYVSMNLFKFETDVILPCLQKVKLSVRGEKELPAAVNIMICEFPGSMLGIPVSEHVPDLTSAEDIPLIFQMNYSGRRENSGWR